MMDPFIVPFQIRFLDGHPAVGASLGFQPDDGQRLFYRPKNLWASRKNSLGIDNSGNSFLFPSWTFSFIHDQDFLPAAQYEIQSAVENGR